MNKYASEICVGFRRNKEHIRNALSNEFRTPRGDAYLSDHLESNMMHFMSTITRELQVTDPMPGVTIEDQIKSFTQQFISEKIPFIRAHVLRQEESIQFAINDGYATSERGVQHYEKSANDILNVWRSAPAKNIQMREDIAGDRGQKRDLSHGLQTGIMFCDQSHLGTQNHVEMYENALYKNSLNAVSREDAYLLVPFGVSNHASDQRLLSRRIFKNNEAGVESGIKRYQARLHNRAVDRDVSESCVGEERGNINRGYDMSGITKRIDHRMQVKAYHEDKNNRYM
jgi:hypothetical protein